MRRLRLLIGVVAWPSLARLVRNEVVALRRRDFVLAARQMGAGPAYLARVHLLPIMGPLLAVNATFLLGDAILSLSALSFLRPRDPAAAHQLGPFAGRGDGAESRLRSWWLILPPGALIAASLLAADLVGSAWLSRQIPPMTDMVLRMEGVGVGLPMQGGGVRLLEDLTLGIHDGEMLALVGESGSGKSTAALSVPRLLPPGAELSGNVTLNGQLLTGLPEASMRRLRGRAIGMMFQDALAALNPSHSVGAQIAEPAMLHLGLSRQAAKSARGRPAGPGGYLWTP